MNERKFVEGRLIYPLRSVDYILVGSSRVMEINSSMVGKPILQFTASGASIEDDIAFGLEALAKLNYRNIYISADPWLINAFDGQNRYKSVSDLYDYWFDLMSRNQPSQMFLTSLGSQPVNGIERNSLAVIRENLRPSSQLVPTDGSVEAIAKKAYDGSHIYNEAYVNQTPDIRFDVLNYSMRDFEYDPQSIRNLEMFVSYLQSNGVNVTLVLSPYHPELYQSMQSEKPIFLEIENWFRSFAKNNNVGVIGSYDASSVGCFADEFYDGMHPKSSCMQKIFVNPIE